MNDRNSLLITGVIKPGRYTDHELNASRKAWEGAEVRLCLAYPDQYEIGMSNLGLAILYSVVNRLPWALADRVYLPASDMEAALRQRGITLKGLESGRPLRNFDVLGITLQTELCYTNVLSILDLAAIPRRAAERREGDPIILAGGSCCANPEPLAAFLDAMAIGDGEDLIVDIMESLRDSKSQTRKSKIERLAKISGVYVPTVHSPKKDVIFARHVSELKPEYSPQPPLVPLVEVTHDRLTVEIARGCTRGCRFCQAGMLYRPVRFRSQQQVLDLVKAGLASSGWEEVSLLSLSSNDYPDFPSLLDQVNGLCLPQRVAVSVPSLRLDSFDQAMAGCLKRIKRSSLTFAPEAGSQRLRDAVNKGLSDEHLFTALDLARRNGWQAVKLYFMIGLPTETEDDVQGIIALCRRASSIGLNLKVTISPFVPKPQTPFQWEAQCGLRELDEKIELLRRGLRLPRVQAHWHDPRSSIVEGVLARGGPEAAEIIEKAYLGGARFDQWTEHFRWDVWQEVLASIGMDVRQSFGARDTVADLPWGHIDFGVKREFLLRERERALASRTTTDCRQAGCHGCGADCEGIKSEEAGQRVAAGLIGSASSQNSSPSDSGAYGRGKRAVTQKPQVTGTRFRIKYGKGPELKFISHLDTMRLWQRAIRRAGIPIAYSQGFSPHQKVSFGPPLPLGMTSRGEYLDLQLEKAFIGDIAARLKQFVNKGIQVLEARTILKESPSLSSWVDAMEYEATWPDFKRDEIKAKIDIISKKAVSGEGLTIKTERNGKIFEGEAIQQIKNINLLNNNKIIIIIKVLDKGFKPLEIIKNIFQIEVSTEEIEVERVEMYHDSSGFLLSPFNSLDAGDFIVRG